MFFYNPRLKMLARKLRREMTDTERLLWSRLRGKQLKDKQFYRQRIIGNYIVDFYCPGAKLIIEVNGGQHNTEKGIEKDKSRDRYLAGQGFKVLRFSDTEVLRETEAVVESIYMSI